MPSGRISLSAKSLANGLIIVEFILCACMIWFTFSQNEELVSDLFAASFVVLAGIFLLIFSSRANELMLLCIGIIAVSFLSVMFSWHRNMVALTFENLKDYFMFCSSIIFCYVATTVTVTKKMAKTILIIAILISTLFPLGQLVFRFSRHAQRFFTMNFSNPNLTGMFLLQAIMFSLLGLLLLKGLFAKILCPVLAVFSTVLLYWTEARNALIALVLAVALVLWCLSRKKTQLPRWLLVFLSLFPMIFVYLYLGLVPIFQERGAFGFLLRLGKTLDSRTGIWTHHFQVLRTCWPVGDYFRLHGNAHNSLLLVLSSFGILVMFATIRYLYLVMREINQNNNCLQQAVCLTAFCATLFMGMGEGAFFCGACGLPLLSCIPLFLARYDWGQKETLPSTEE